MQHTSAADCLRAIFVAGIYELLLDFENYHSISCLLVTFVLIFCVTSSPVFSNLSWIAEFIVPVGRGGSDAHALAVALSLFVCFLVGTRVIQLPSAHWLDLMCQSQLCWRSPADLICSFPRLNLHL